MIRRSLAGAVVRKELATLWVTPIPYVTGALFHAALGLLAVDTFQSRAQAVFQPVVPIAAFLLLVVVPIFTMRLIADERRSGTLDVLLAIPVRPLALIAGKWIAAFVSVVVLLVPVSLHAVLLAWWGDPDLGPVVSGMFGLALLAAAAVAVGILASSLTSSQPVAALTASFVLLAGWFLRPATDSVTFRTLTARLSLNERIRTFAGGGIDLGDASFLLALTAVPLLSAAALVFARRGRRPGTRPLVVIGLAAVLLLVAQWAVDEQRRVLDLTAESSLSLAAETLEVIDGVDEPVTVTVFLRPDEPGRDEARALLDRYEEHNRRIEASIVDPDDAPGEVRRLGVDPIFGGVALEMGDDLEIVPAPVEQDLTLGLARLLRGDLPRVCVTTGHGELDTGSTLPNGASSLVGMLTDNGYEVFVVDLLAGASLDGCGAVLVLAPATSLGAAAADELARHLDADGRVAVFAEPGFDIGLDPLLATAGLRVLPGIVAEGDPDSVFSGDPTAPLIRRYSSASPIVRNLPPSFFVTVGGIGVVDDELASGYDPTRLADTSGSSVLVDDLTDEDASATPGPITVAAASERSGNVDGDIRRSRVVLVADGDVVANSFVTEAGNGQLLVQTVDWLTVDDDLVSVSSNLAEPRPLLLTSARRAYARLLTVGLVPAMFLVVGGFVFLVRRGR